VSRYVVRGMVTIARVPFATSETRETFLPSASTMLRTMARPKPDPVLTYSSRLARTDQMPD
jgi:hypothetical protein